MWKIYLVTYRCKNQSKNYKLTLGAKNSKQHIKTFLCKSRQVRLRKIAVMHEAEKKYRDLINLNKIYQFSWVYKFKPFCLICAYLFLHNERSLLFVPKNMFQVFASNDI